MLTVIGKRRRKCVAIPPVRINRADVVLHFKTHTPQVIAMLQKRVRAQLDSVRLYVCMPGEGSGRRPEPFAARFKMERLKRGRRNA